MTVRTHENDLADMSAYQDVSAVAVDTEAMGLKPHRDRLCVVQISPGDGSADVITIDNPPKPAPNLRHILTAPNILKIYHFARFDLAILQQYLDISAGPAWCTKIASRLARTYTDRHGLRDLARELLKVEISKQQQSSNWSARPLSQAQIQYAASDVLYLHSLREQLSSILEAEGRLDLAQNCFDFLHTRAHLDLRGWEDTDIFAHS